MPWEPLTMDERRLYAAIRQARQVSEEVDRGVSTLAASGVLDVVVVSFKYDRCRELLTHALEYARGKVKEKV